MIKRENLEKSTILHYIDLVLNIKETFEQPYCYDVKKPDFNFYVSEYWLVREKWGIRVCWVNPNHEEHFANAREVRNYFERCIERQATRVVSEPNIDANSLTTFKLPDVIED